MAWLIGRLRALIRWTLRLALLTCLAVAGWTALWPLRDPGGVADADAIACLGAGVAADGSLDPATSRRVEACVALYEARVAPVMVMSAGAAAPGAPDGATGMARLAMDLGVPASAILIEPRAQSTLQNALFTLAMLPDADRVVIVTEAFHLPRSWASFRWAALGWSAPPELDLFASERVRAAQGAPDWPSVHILLREAAALWFNGARALAHGIGGWIGVPEAERTAWLH